MNRRRRDKSNRRNDCGLNASSLFRRHGTETLIDGYNLLHVTRFQPRGHSEGELRRCREGLLDLVAQKLCGPEPCHVTFVFDAAYAPSHLASQMDWLHLKVRFARDQNSADDLIIELVRNHANPSSLIVVSSDHRVQVAAGRRKAQVVDSDAWFEQLLAFEATDVENEPDDAVFDRDASEDVSESPFPADYLDELKREFPGEI